MVMRSENTMVKNMFCLMDVLISNLLWIELPKTLLFLKKSHKKDNRTNLIKLKLQNYFKRELVLKYMTASVNIAYSPTNIPSHKKGDFLYFFIKGTIIKRECSTNSHYGYLTSISTFPEFDCKCVWCCPSGKCIIEYEDMLFRLDISWYFYHNTSHSISYSFSFLSFSTYLLLWNNAHSESWYFFRLYIRYTEIELTMKYIAKLYLSLYCRWSYHICIYFCIFDILVC